MSSLFLALCEDISPDAPDLPAGYSLNNYQPGDHRSWLDIMTRSHPKAPVFSFNRQIRRQPAFRPGRLLFCRCNGQAVGTVFAGYDPGCPGWGLLSDLAVLPDHRHKGLATAMIWEALRIIQSEGRSGVRALVDPQH